MSLAIFKLESFSAALAGHGDNQTATIAAVEQAYADGLAEGVARKQDAEIRSLKAGLDSLAQSLSADEGRRAKLRHEAVEALAPILEQMLDCVLPASETRRMESALTEELMRLSRSASPVHARISCNARLRALVERCLAESGIETVELVETDANCIGLTLQGGQIELSPDRTAADIRALIHEIRGDGSKWTN